MSKHPLTELVILAAGQARRMNGVNKLLQRFDHDIQLIKIYKNFKDQVQQTWVNSHRDLSRYQSLIPDIQCYADDEAGFLGPLMGIKSAWSHCTADYILFIPCDITDIPAQCLLQLHQALEKHPSAQVAYAVIQEQAVYPFCLIKRSSLPIVMQHIQQQQWRLKTCFADLNPQPVHLETKVLRYHSLNSFEELRHYHCLALRNSQPIEASAHEYKD